MLYEVITVAAGGIFQADGIVVGFDHPFAIESSRLPRITSYNVCYTKLLRIRWSVNNRFFVLLATIILVGIGMYSLKNTPVDAIPDLSDVQVIIKTSYPGQAPQVVEDSYNFV